MFNIMFSNDKGCVKMGGGQHDLFRIKEIKGLGLPAKDFSIVSHVGESGQTTISQRVLSRTITFSGDFLGSQRQLSKITKILFHDGVLTFYFNNIRRKIHAKCVDFSDPIPVAKGISSLVLQFVCDKPEFMDLNNTTVNLFQTINNLGPTFTLPVVFTERRYTTSIVNYGDLDIEPIIHIYTKKIKSQPTGEGMLIENLSTGRSLRLNYPYVDGDYIKIDVPERTITSSINGNILNYIEDNSFLSDIVFTPGENTIKITNFNFNYDVQAVSEYSNRYVEMNYAIS